MPEFRVHLAVHVVAPDPNTAKIMVVRLAQHGIQGWNVVSVGLDEDRTEPVEEVEAEDDDA